MGRQRSVSKQFGITVTGHPRINALSRTQSASQRLGVTICIGFFQCCRLRAHVQRFRSKPDSYVGRLPLW